MNSEGVSAKESVASQKVKEVVDVFTDKKGSGHDAVKVGDDSKSNGNSGEMRSIDITV